VPDHRQCDVVIVGAGSAGLSAARTVARLGLDTVLLERMPAPGSGQFPRSAVLTLVPGFVSGRRLLDGCSFPHSTFLSLPLSHTGLSTGTKVHQPEWLRIQRVFRQPRRLPGRGRRQTRPSETSGRASPVGRSPAAIRDAGRWAPGRERTGRGGADGKWPAAGAGGHGGRGGRPPLMRGRGPV